MSTTPNLQIQETLTKSFEMFKAKWMDVLKGFAVIVVIQILANVLVSMAEGNSLVSLLFSLVNMVASMGFTVYILDLVRGGSPTLAAFTSKINNFLNYFITSLVVGLLTVLGFVLLIVPGIYVALRFAFAPILAIDKNWSVGKAMEGSTKMTEGLMMQLFFFGIVAFVINLLGAIPFGLGLLITMPVTWIAGTKIYLQLESRLKDMEA